ncbi:MAG: hypothetical protein RI572_13855 [Salegentibacter sp.]|uniref:hypothetical protein n=1 Tax=Salegentibacter sp. TaxID=1903072 RepID=UPI0028701009|nr:hypothetical protein [Salegentibacter sp.]MDR9458485.1 hypothetical protein [Salegentibacter sp.]
MKNLRAKGKKWVKRALAFKVGKYAVRKGGLLGVGIGAVAGVAYLSWRLSKKCKTEHGAERLINEITADKERQIVV